MKLDRGSQSNVTPLAPRGKIWVCPVPTLIGCCFGSCNPVLSRCTPSLCRTIQVRRGLPIREVPREIILMSNFSGSLAVRLCRVSSLCAQLLPGLGCGAGDDQRPRLSELGTAGLLTCRFAAAMLPHRSTCPVSDEDTVPQAVHYESQLMRCRLLGWGWGLLQSNSRNRKMPPLLLFLSLSLFQSLM